MSHSILYTESVLNFVSDALSLCALLEPEMTTTLEFDRDVAEQLRESLTRVYLSALRLPLFDSDPFAIRERFVTEEQYNRIQERQRRFWGSNDVFLETEVHDMQYSDTPIAVSLSEYLSDVYQELADTTWAFRQQVEGQMLASIAQTQENFGTEWGIKLLSALRQVHVVLSNERLLDEADMPSSMGLEKEMEDRYLDALTEKD